MTLQMTAAASGRARMEIRPPSPHNDAFRKGRLWR